MMDGRLMSIGSFAHLTLWGFTWFRVISSFIVMVVRSPFLFQLAIAAAEHLTLISLILYANFKK